MSEPPAGVVPPGMAARVGSPLGGGDGVKEAGRRQQEWHVTPRVSVSCDKAMGGPSVVPPTTVFSDGWG